MKPTTQPMPLGASGRRRLILWDIDGTLMRAGPAGRDALMAGAAVAAGLAAVPSVPMSGKTDPQIVREIFALAEVADDRIDTLMPTALAAVTSALARAEDRIRADGVVLPGVMAVLQRLAATPGVRQTLVTGNLVANAALKLTALGLEGFLDVEVGAYGTDHADRNRLVPIALARVQRPAGRVLPARTGVGGRRHRVRPGVRPGRRGALPAGRDGHGRLRRGTAAAGGRRPARSGRHRHGRRDPAGRVRRGAGWAGFVRGGRAGRACGGAGRVGRLHPGNGEGNGSPGTIPFPVG